MAGLTLEHATTQLNLWLAADAAVSQNQSYTLPNGRQLTRAHAAEVRTNIDYWDQKCRQLSRGGVPVRGGIPT